MMALSAHDETKDGHKNHIIPIMLRIRPKVKEKANLPVHEESAEWKAYGRLDKEALPWQRIASAIASI